MKNRDKRMEEIKRYLDGKMSGKERNDFERGLQGDPFEEEAMEGFSQLSSVELDKDMDLLDEKLKKRVHRRTPVYYRIAAAVVVLMAISSLFLVRELRKPAMMMSENVIELKDTIAEEPGMSEEFSRESVKEDIFESPVGQVARRSKAQEKQAAQEIELIDDQLILDLEPVMEEEEALEVYDLEIRDSIVITEEQVEGEMLREVKVAEAVEEEVVDPEGNFAQERTISSAKAKKAPQVVAPVKAEAQTDMEVKGVAAGEEVVVSDPAGIADRTAGPFGGMKAFKAYLETDQIFPDDWDASDKEIVKLELTIGRAGEIKKIEVIKSSDNRFSDEARRLIKEGPPWSAAIRSSEKVEEIVKLRIVFKR